MGSDGRFAALSGHPLRDGKRSTDGAARRLLALMKHGQVLAALVSTAFGGATME